MAAAGPPAKHYQSAFKAPQLRSEFLSAPALTFDSYQFMQTFCTVNGEGGIMLIEKSESETILVAKGWQKFAWVASQLKLVFQLNIISLRDIQSLLSESVQWPRHHILQLMMLSQQGVLGSVHHTIFQARPLGIYRSTETENTADLTNELKVLSIAQYFLDTFKMCAVSYGYTSLPGMCLNLTPSPFKCSIKVMLY